MSTPKWLMLLIVISIMIIVIHPGVGYAQAEGGGDAYCFDLSDTKTVAKCLQDSPILRQMLEVKDKQIANLEKENELLKRESDLKDRIIAINEKEIESTRRALNDMKEVTDRSLRLAESSKKGGLLETWGPLAAIAIIVVTIASIL
jgi:hypothetical protein